MSLNEISTGILDNHRNADIRFMEFPDGVHVKNMSEYSVEITSPKETVTLGYLQDHIFEGKFKNKLKAVIKEKASSSL